jgi:hypothetical protein
MGQMRNAYKILVGKPEWKHFGVIVIDGRIILIDFKRNKV